MIIIFNFIQKIKMNILFSIKMHISTYFKKYLFLIICTICVWVWGVQEFSCHQRMSEGWSWSYSSCGPCDAGLGAEHWAPPGPRPLQWHSMCSALAFHFSLNYCFAWLVFQAFGARSITAMCHLIIPYSVSLVVTQPLLPQHRIFFKFIH